MRYTPETVAILGESTAATNPAFRPTSAPIRDTALAGTTAQAFSKSAISNSRFPFGSARARATTRLKDGRICVPLHPLVLVLPNRLTILTAEDSLSMANAKHADIQCGRAQSALGIRTRFTPIKTRHRISGIRGRSLQQLCTPRIEAAQFIEFIGLAHRTTRPSAGRSQKAQKQDSRT